MEGVVVKKEKRHTHILDTHTHTLWKYTVSQYAPVLYIIIEKSSNT